MMRPALTLGFVGLLLTASPGSAGSLFGKPDKDTPSAIAASIVVAGFSAIVCGSVASAGRSEDLPEDSYARPGFLLGGSGIYAADTSEGDLESALRKERAAPVNFSLKDSFGFKSQAGYRCHPRFSAEVDVEWLDGFDGSAFENGAGKVATIDFEPVVITTNLKGYALTGRYQPYALVGGGMMTVKVKTKDALGTDTETATNVAMRFGGGLDFYATEHVVLTLGIDYVLPFGDLQDLDYVSIGWGLRYRF